MRKILLTIPNAFVAFACLIQIGMAQDIVPVTHASVSIDDSAVNPQAANSETVETRWFANFGPLTQKKKSLDSGPILLDESEPPSHLRPTPPNKHVVGNGEPHPTRIEQLNRNTREIIHSSRESVLSWGARSGAAFRSASEEIRQSSSRTWESITGSLRRSPPGEIEAKPKPLQRGPVDWHSSDSRR